MKFTYNWLKDFVEIKLGAAQLAEQLTMAGLEVTSLEEKLGDFVFEVEVTSNRPDWLSVVGIAREVAAITGKKSRKSPSAITSCDFRSGIGKRFMLSYTIKKATGQKLKIKGYKGQGLVVEAEDKKDCPLYTAKIIRGVKVAPSPEWLRQRLELVGCRSINNVVDITNYILLTFGEPLHAFDLDKISGSLIRVRRAKKGEKLTTIDGEVKELNDDILVIADEKKPVALAGIMGGKDSEVSYNTQNILLEAAVFDPQVIRRSRQRLSLQSESSYRFERGVDLASVGSASQQAVRLIQEICNGVCVLAKSCGTSKFLSKKINLSARQVRETLGSQIPAARIKQVLSGLGFKLSEKGKNNFSIQRPSFRSDVNSEVDLIEEVARIVGYEKIPLSLPAIIPQITLWDTRSLVSRAKEILIGLGLQEVITYSLVAKELIKAEEPALDPLEILNPLSKDQQVLRPTLIPSLSQCIAYNLNQKQEYIGIFEVAKVFTVSLGSSPQENLALGLGLCGEKSQWLNQGCLKQPAGLLDLKGILETFFLSLGITDYDFKMGSAGLEAAIYLNQQKVGRLLKIKPPILNYLGIKNKEVFAAELYLEEVLPRIKLEKKFNSLPKYPAISRDISLVIKEAIPAQDILKMIKENAGKLLKDVGVIDYYKGKQIPAGFKGLTVSCVYRSDERTLTEEEINPLQNLICQALVQGFGAQVR